MRVMLYEAAQSLLARTAKLVLAQGLGDADRQAPRQEEGHRRAGAPTWPSSCTASGLTAPSSAGAGKRPRQHDNARSQPDRRKR